MGSKYIKETPKGRACGICVRPEQVGVLLPRKKWVISAFWLRVDHKHSPGHPCSCFPFGLQMKSAPILSGAKQFNLRHKRFVNSGVSTNTCSRNMETQKNQQKRLCMYLQRTSTVTIRKWSNLGGCPRKEGTVYCTVVE